MVTSTGAPAALQPDDTEAAAEYDVQARAGEWYGRRVMHEPSHEFGRIVGRDPGGCWWVEIALVPHKPADTVLMRGDVLMQVTPELEALVEAERARRLAAEELATENKRRFTRNVPSLRAAREPGAPSRKGIYPDDHDGLRYCGRCQEWLPVADFRMQRGHGPRRVCLTCERKDGHRARNGARRQEAQWQR